MNKTQKAESDLSKRDQRLIAKKLIKPPKPNKVSIIVKRATDYRFKKASQCNSK